MNDAFILDLEKELICKAYEEAIINFINLEQYYY